MSDSAADTVVSENWYAESFGALYPILYAHRTVEAAEPEAAFAARILDLHQDDRIFDLCCGTGRHMIHLQKHCGSVTGLDFSADLLRIARANLGDGTHLVRGDMRVLPFVNQFDVATNFFTSFGYFRKDADNAEVIVQLAHSVRTRGRVYMDYLNPTFLQESLESSSERVNGEYRIQENRWLENVPARVNKTTLLWQNGEQIARLEESVRMYELSEMQEMYQAAGLRVRDVYGNHDGTGFAPGQPRMILVAEKLD